MIIIKTTIDHEELANKIANTLLEKRLAGCIQFIPIKSIYLWKGEVEKSSELMMLIKTKEDLKDKAVEEIKALHSYETPEIVVIKGEANIEYLQWLNSELINK